MQEPNFFDWVTSPRAAGIIAGAFGGVMRWITLRERWRDGMTSILAGGICAAFIAPLAEPIFRQVLGGVLPNGDAGPLSGFLVGLGGMTITAILINVVKLWGQALKEAQK